MLKKVETYIRKNNLLANPDKLIVGVSGGADSVAILLLLKNLDYECIVAHCNFHLRHDESDRDEEFVRNLAERLKFQFCKVDFDTTEFAYTNKLSIEMAARQLRYKWFEELRLQHNAQCIVVAHHADDNVETLLMNLTRGTGIRGLTGISARNGNIVRPLLCCTRDEIIEFLRKNDEDFVTDSSNLQNKYTRNRFRNQIIPQFEQLNPSFRKSLDNSIKRFVEIEKIYNERIELEIKNVVSCDNDNTLIDIEKLKHLSFSNSLLFEILYSYHFHPDTIEKIHSNLNNLPGAVYFSNTHRLLFDRKYLIISELKDNAEAEYSIEENDSIIEFPVRLSITQGVYNGHIHKSKLTAAFDAAKITFPLKIRKWKKADFFVPFGMETRKKISDFFIDNKINRFEKENIWLLLSGNDIIWVIGHRIDNRYKLNGDSKNIIEFNLLADI